MSAKIVLDGEIHSSGLKLLKELKNIELISIKNDWEKNLDCDMVVNFHEINYINK